MSKITDLTPINSLETNRKAPKAAGGFDDLLNSNIATTGLADDLLAQINAIQNDNYQDFSNGGSVFPFSSAFGSTFGLTGPLPTWINTITSKLGLSQAQNSALQDIAVRFKDITKTAANVEAISAELKKAGIGA